MKQIGQAVYQGHVVDEVAASFDDVQVEARKLGDILNAAGCRLDRSTVLGMIALAVLNAREAGMVDESFDRFVAKIREIEGPEERKGPKAH